ncbi:MAG: D-alanine--D-alanine ligase [Candidatus Omnitrophica bacterium]|nr:D-alanine--D-alanine ligase [Candidatus Omnitrophota bacterium]
MGGRSAEREISLKSGSAVLDALKNTGFNAIPLEILDETEVEIRRLISSSGVQVVFIAMHGGFGEDGRLQHILEKARLPYTGPQERASRLAMDKIVSRRLFEKAGLSVPRYRCIKKGLPRFFSKLSLAGFKYPYVIKPSAQGSSIGISFIDLPSRLDVALDAAFGFGDEVVVEEFISGREITVSVFDGRALPIVEIIPKKKFFDFQAKYEKGLTEYVVPATLDEKVARRAQEDATIAYHTLGCRHLSRVDMIIDKKGAPVILEVNTIPGMTATSLFPKAAAAAGIGFSDVCTRLLELACEAPESR